MKELLKNLTNTPCVPQYQEEMIDFLKKEIEFGELETDFQGNVRIASESSDDKIALMAYLNEIGFAVEQIEDSGFLRFQSTSDVDERFLLGKRMKIYGGSGGVRGGNRCKATPFVEGFRRDEKS